MLYYGVHLLGVKSPCNWDKTLLAITVSNTASIFRNTEDHFECVTSKDPKITLWFCFTSFSHVKLFLISAAP